MKMANGYGSVYRLSGNRRRPYVAMVTVRTVYDENNDKYKLERKALGYFATQNEARKCLADYNSHQYDAELIGITFGEVWETIQPRLESTLSEHRLETFKAFYKYMKPIEGMKMSDIKTCHLQKVFDDCPRSSSTKDVLKAMLNKAYDYAIENDIVMKNYTEFVKYTKDDSRIQRVLFETDYIDEIRQNQFKPYNAVTIVLLYTGMRVREFINNKSENIDLENKMIYVPKELAKNKTSERYVPIHDDIVPILENFKSYNNRYIAMRTSKCKIEYQPYYEFLKKIGHTPHDTRHTFISRARECGMDALVLQRIVGHTSKNITETVYTHISNEELLSEMSKLKY